MTLIEAPRLFTLAGKFLKKVNLSHNRLTQIPAEMFQQCVVIEHLNLARNQLESLPSSLSNLSKLAEIDLSGNNLTHNLVQQEEGQSEIEFAKSLKVINLSQNNFTKVPAFAYKIETVDL